MDEKCIFPCLWLDHDVQVDSMGAVDEEAGLLQSIEHEGGARLSAEGFNESLMVCDTTFLSSVAVSY